MLITLKMLGLRGNLTGEQPSLLRSPSPLPLPFSLYLVCYSQCLFDSWLTQKEELVRSIKTSKRMDQAETVACLRRLAVSVPAQHISSFLKLLRYSSDKQMHSPNL